MQTRNAGLSHEPHGVLGPWWTHPTPRFMMLSQPLGLSRPAELKTPAQPRTKARRLSVGTYLLYGNELTGRTPDAAAALRKTPRHRCNYRPTGPIASLEASAQALSSIGRETGIMFSDYAGVLTARRRSASPLASKRQSRPGRPLLVSQYPSR